MRHVLQLLVVLCGVAISAPASAVSTSPFDHISAAASTYSSIVTERFLALRAVAEEIEQGRRLPFQAKNMIEEMLNANSFQAGLRKYSVGSAVELGRTNPDPDVRAMAEEWATVFDGFEGRLNLSLSDWQEAFAQAAADDATWRSSVRERALLDARLIQDIEAAQAKTLPFAYPHLFPEEGVVRAHRIRQIILAEILSLELAATQGTSPDGVAARDRMKHNILALRDAAQDIRSQARTYLAATEKFPEATSEDRARKRHLLKLFLTYPIVADHEDAFADMFDAVISELDQVPMISWRDTMILAERRAETLREITRSFSAAISVIDLK